MATPMSPAQFAAALRAEGVTVVEVDDWKTHNRNHKGAWGPVHGVMIHHTVTSGTARTVAICRDGYSSLPGPLCHGVIAKDGRVHLVGYGRANHAGLGDSDVLRAVVNETKLPPDNEADTDGNRHFYGFECENLGDGKDPWPEAQLLALERVAAAICRVHGWNERSVIGHLEWQPGKVDPRGFTMDAMRARIAKRLKAGAPAPAKPSTPSAPAKPKLEPFPGTAFFMTNGKPALGKNSKIFTAMGKRLVAVGCGRYKVGPGPTLGQADVDSYEAWQRKCGYTGTAAKWPPGPTTWNKLQVPNV
ncbi:N-acetylmuramoyl-L-alanine amidase [Streptomyces shenzhenensis]|uniref:N-acetylmuramoyl-L-alanine amidase n=1 Tax=Streptomyces shenzhenensis TaxID=943815 RepID=A0A3M0IH98_9ACTN|nr:peptidoglycan-binding protein [Streptomyces shenzhenensis]RMB85629.1 N-acetylmuramoyl-L-alanine amidase [Streptomyces shenzhenensis]